MDKRNFLLICFGFIFLSLISFSGAVVQANFDVYSAVIGADGSFSYSNNPVAGFAVDGYLCGNSDCSIVGDMVVGLTSSTSGESITLEFPTVLAANGYLLYFYKDGYIGMEGTGIKVSGSGNWNGHDVYLFRKATGWAPIMNLDVVDEVSPGTPIEVGVSIEIDADTYAAIKDSRSSNVPLNEDVETLVSFEIVDSGDNVVYSDSEVLSIEYSGVEDVSFVYPGFAVGEEGDYDFVVYTDVTDDKVLNSVRQSAIASLSVLGEDTNDYWYTLISGLEMSPVMPDVDEAVTFDFDYVSDYFDNNGNANSVDTDVEVEFFRNSVSLGVDSYTLDLSSSEFSFDESFDNAGNYVLVVSGLPSGAPTDADVFDSSQEISFIVSGIVDDDWDNDGYTKDVDCNDYDASVWRMLIGYTDNDGDSYGVSPSFEVCSGNNLPIGYSSVSGDCDDGNSNVNPCALEICDDDIDNDCDGYIDEGCDFVPTVFVSGSPLSGVFPLDVSFNCQGVGGNGGLDYVWDFGNGDTSSAQNPKYTYLESGDFEAICTVSDEDDDEASGSVEMKIAKQTLDIDELVCFDQVIEGHNQSCIVYVKNSLGDAVGKVDVDFFYSNGDFFGSCLTDGVTGACGVKDLQDEVGSFEVYAVASKSGYLDDDSSELKFDYDVLKEAYTIVNLKIYNDVDFSVENYDFFRGENMYIKFNVEDLDGGVIESDFISSVSLVSPLVGGRVDLELVKRIGGVYYYKLIPIPATHEFLGDSNVFAFVFNIDDKTGGQAEVSLMIRNNLPVISPDIPLQDERERMTGKLNLALYESDVEDSGDDLRWEVVSFSDGVEVNLVGKKLFFLSINKGDYNIVLRLFDLDGDYDEQVLNVVVNKKRSDKDDSTCDASWKCSIWGDCVSGFENRICIDVEGCQDSSNKPLEILICGSSSYANVSSDVVAFWEPSVSKDNGFSFWWIIALIALVIFMFVLIFLLM